MANREWDPAWGTGNAIIDSQYEQLFQQLMRLNLAVAAGKGDGEDRKLAEPWRATGE